MSSGGSNTKKYGLRGEKRLWGLNVLFLVLLIIIVGLVVWIIINSVGQSGGGDDEPMTVEEAEQAYRQSLIDNDKSYQISLEISTIYNEGDKERALKMYDEELNKTLEEENYDLYNQLITARSTMLILDGTCEELVAQYDKVKIDMIPKGHRGVVYDVAINDTARCGDTEREAYWRKLADED
jgi:hypothetical protein